MAGGTNFEGINHPQLKSMIATSDPSKVTSRGNQLKDAGRVLDDLSRALAAHVGQIQWEGPAAENFKTWAGNLNKSAAMISEYSKGAGDAMVQAGEALSGAKTGVPEVPAKDVDMVKRHATQPCLRPSPLSIAGFGNPTAMTDAIMKKEDPTWVSSAEAAAAQKRVDTAHQEAIHQMEKLGQAYEAATAKLNGLKLPELPGTPGDGPKAVDGGTEVPVGPAGGRYGSGGTGTGRGVGGGYSGGGYVSTGGGYGGGGGSVTPRPPVSVPDGPRAPGHSTPTPPRGSVPLPSDPNTPGAVIPPATFPGDRPSTGLDSLPTVPTLPGQTGPVGPAGGGPVSPYPQGGGPGHPGMPGGGPGPFPGGGPIPMGGTGPFTSGTTPLKGGGGGPVPVNRTGPFGGGNPPAKNGAPVPTNGGTVFGAREAAQGRAAGGPGGGGGFGGPAGGMHPGGGGHGGGAVGGSRGRGYSSTGGGVVGGVVGGGKSPTAGGEFTPGGSGLRNRASAAGAAAAEGAARPGQNGMMGPGMMGGAGERRERDRRQRADYLHEDEETWTSGTPKSNPSVIE
ncbi:WXG100 family type VII secretion target [Kitasatospora sp. NPDC008115]|uniref:WXG100 family type VII secretion target n=1 Tax=Kitasatospora sp. NPDC008115 TaxID=3364022 RepID=UPI0036EEBB7D